MMRMRTVALHVLILWNLAVAQPLLDVVGRSGHFFIAHRSSPLDILLLIALVCLAAPCVLIGLIGAAGLLRLRPATHVAAIWALASTLVLLWTKPFVGGSATLHFAAALAIGSFLTFAYVRAALVRLFVTCLTPAVVIIPGAFLWTPDIWKQFVHEPAPTAMAAGSARPIPVVLIVFDELPLVSLLDEHAQIDANNYPNFARLGRQAHWFRNATTVSQHTLTAIPAILTGRYPVADRLPTATDFPENLFTLLTRTHALHAFEQGTQLCPETLCEAEIPIGSAPKRMVRLLGDLTVVYLRILLPAELADRLPRIDGAWNNFLQQTLRAPARSPATAADFFRVFAAASQSNRSARFRRFVEGITPASSEPGFYYLHSMITHVPWRRLPSGQWYDDTVKVEGLLPNETWSSDPSQVAQGYYRHLLQVGFADRLLGELMDRLKATGVYDDALLIVTADHGASFRPGDRRRHLTPTNVGGIAAVPLLIKLPGQVHQVVSDRPVQSIDITPTVAAVLDVKLPWPVDGQSVYADDEPRHRVAYDDDLQPFDLPDDLSLLLAPLRRKHSMLAGQGNRWQWPGPMSHLVGRSITEFPLHHAAGISALLDDERLLLEVDPEGEFIPVHIRGTIRADMPLPLKAGVAVAVNGVIRATTWTSRDDKTDRFSVMFREEALRAGSNEIDVLLLPDDHMDGPLRTLRRQHAPVYRLEATPDAERIVDGAHRQYLVTPGAVRGYIDRWNALDRIGSASGWAADLQAMSPAVAVVGFVNGEFAGAAFMTFDRPDIVTLSGSEGPRRSGFVLRVLSPSTVDLESAEVRLFAISESGRASEIVNRVEGVRLGPHRR
jgi:hypothetical protein